MKASDRCGGKPETWKSIPGFIGYEASSLGRLRSFWKNRYGLTQQPKMLRTSLDSEGYLSFHPKKSGGRKITLRVHTAVALAFHGPPPSRVHEVCHSDGNRLNNLPGNLRWGTRRENSMDTILHDRIRRKFTIAKILAMRADYPALSMRAIERKHGVSHRTLQQIIKRERWAHI